MHRNIVLCFVGLLYYSLVGYALISFDIGSLTSALFLFGAPAYFLARFSAAPAAVLISVTAFGAGMAFLLEGIAHITGIWYFVGVEELRLFGVIPLEVIAISILQTLFLTLLYELVFDDGEYSESHARVRFAALGVFAVGVLLLLSLHLYLLHGVFFSHSYVWILVTLVGASLAALSVEKTLTLRFFDRLVLFTCVSAVPLLVWLLVSVAHTYKVFAYTHDYFYTFTIFGSAIPLEEILLSLAFPLFVATFYELYLDDGK